jgi:putative heme transporter
LTDATHSAVPLDAVSAPAQPTKKSAWLTWGRRALVTVLMVVAAYEAYQHRSEIETGAKMLGHLQPGWLVVAVVAEAASMVVFARLQRWLLRAGGVQVPLRSMVEIVLAGNAMSTSLPGGAAWAAAWAFGQLRRRGSNRVLAGWVVLVAGALASFALFVLVAVGSWVAGGHGPVAGFRWVAAALASIPFILAFGYVEARRSDRVHHLFVTSWQAICAHSSVARLVSRFTSKTVHDLGLVRPGPAGWAEAFVLAATNWLCDAACFLACILALGFAIPWRGLLVIYALTQISASLPITPGGLGVVEGTMAALLIAYGTRPTAAFAIVLLYRIISFWGLVPIGWGAWFALEIAQRSGLRHRPHPWAVHLHGKEPARIQAPVGPEHILRPKPCMDCTGDSRPQNVDASARRAG